MPGHYLNVGLVVDFCDTPILKQNMRFRKRENRKLSEVGGIIIHACLFILFFSREERQRTPHGMSAKKELGFNHSISYLRKYTSLPPEAQAYRIWLGINLTKTPTAHAVVRHQGCVW